MIAEILTAILSAIVELLLQLIAEAAVEIGLGSLDRLFPESKPLTSVYAALCFIMLGAVCGVVSAVILPNRIIPTSRFPGLSLLVAPLGAAYAMHLFAGFRSSRGHTPTLLTTWWGAGLFALAMASTRFWLVSQLP